MNLDIVEIPVSCWEDFLRIILIWLSNVSEKSIMIPSNFADISSNKSEPLTVANISSSLMGEGFIFLTGDYRFIGGVHTLFGHAQKFHFYLRYEVEMLHVVS